MTDQNARQEIPSTSFVRIVDGIPSPIYSPIPTAKLINDMAYVAMAARYVPLKDHNGDVREDEKMFDGWTCLEVMWYKRAQLAAQGDLESQKFIHDRTLGKAVQQINTTTVNVTLQEALDHLAERVEKKRPGLIDKRKAEIIDITPMAVQKLCAGDL